MVAAIVKLFWYAAGVISTRHLYDKRIVAGYGLVLFCLCVYDDHSFIVVVVYVLLLTLAWRKWLFFGIS